MNLGIEFIRQCSILGVKQIPELIHYLNIVLPLIVLAQESFRFNAHFNKNVIEFLIYFG